MRYRGVRRRVTGGERSPEAPNRNGAFKFRLELECGHDKEAWYAGRVPSIVTCLKCKAEPEKP